MISIILPVYKAEAYLNRTINALLGQSYRDIELILVNDGSPDGSGLICSRFAVNDRRVRYFEVENGGPSKARNFGIHQAQGEYIGFCDADDIPDREMYQTLFDYLEGYNADVALCDLFSERDNKNFGFPWDDGTSFEDAEIPDELIASMVGNVSDNDTNIPVWGSVVRCLYRKKILDEYRIVFPTDIHYAEDLVFTLTYLSFCKRAVICGKSFYYYTWNRDSLMNSFYKYNPGMFEKRQKLVGYISAVLERINARQELWMRFATTERCYYHECIGNACRREKGRTFGQSVYDVRFMMEDEKVKKAFSCFDAVNRKKRLIYLLIRKKMALLVCLYYTIRLP